MLQVVGIFAGFGFLLLLASPLLLLAAPCLLCCRCNGCHRCLDTEPTALWCALDRLGLKHLPSSYYCATILRLVNCVLLSVLHCYETWTCLGTKPSLGTSVKLGWTCRGLPLPGWHLLHGQQWLPLHCGTNQTWASFVEINLPVLCWQCLWAYV